MKGRQFFILFILFAVPQLSWNSLPKETDVTLQLDIEPKAETFDSYASDFYQNLSTPELEYTVFKTALKGYIRLQELGKLTNVSYLTIADFSKSSAEKRLYIIDIASKSMIHQSLVAHGRNSGLEFANKFSNRVNSHQSSIGFYTTAETYRGKHGYSLRLDGHEYSNSNARKRAIVIHAADYAGEKFVQNNGRLGRSYGCPSLPKQDYERVIEMIKEGSCFFIYYPKSSYLERSKLVNHQVNSLPTS